MCLIIIITITNVQKVTIVLRVLDRYLIVTNWLPYRCLFVTNFVVDKQTSRLVV